MLAYVMAMPIPTGCNSPGPCRPRARFLPWQAASTGSRNPLARRRALLSACALSLRLPARAYSLFRAARWRPAPGGPGRLGRFWRVALPIAGPPSTGTAPLMERCRLYFALEVFTGHLQAGCRWAIRSRRNSYRSACWFRRRRTRLRAREPGRAAHGAPGGHRSAATARRPALACVACAAPVLLGFILRRAFVACLEIPVQEAARASSRWSATVSSGRHCRCGGVLPLPRPTRRDCHAPPGGCCQPRGLLGYAIRHDRGGRAGAAGAAGQLDCRWA
jgi:hypothetical protein